MIYLTSSERTILSRAHVAVGSPVAFRLTSVVPETKKSKRGTSLAFNQADRLRLSILDVPGSEPERFALEDGDANKALKQIAYQPKPRW
jgi:hypothetical protein